MKMMRITMLNLSLLALISCDELAAHAQAVFPGWVTAGANPQRTSWVPDAAPGALKPILGQARRGIYLAEGADHCGVGKTVPFDRAGGVRVRRGYGCGSVGVSH